MLSSLNPVTKVTPIVAPGLGRPFPDPGFGSLVELGSRDTDSLLDLFGIGEALPGEGITSDEPPPTFLPIQPSRPRGNEHVMEAVMIGQPSSGLQTVVTAQIVGDDEGLPARIVCFDVGK